MNDEFLGPSLTLDFHATSFWQTWQRARFALTRATEFPEKYPVSTAGLPPRTLVASYLHTDFCLIFRRDSFSPFADLEEIRIVVRSCIKKSFVPRGLPKRTSMVKGSASNLACRERCDSSNNLAMKRTRPHSPTMR
ncbi:hypothetical protein AB1N83_007830 [Pleurotus pulmonarius]